MSYKITSKKGTSEDLSPITAVISVIFGISVIPVIFATLVDCISVVLKNVSKIDQLLYYWPPMHHCGV